MGKIKMYNTTLDIDLLRKIKILTTQLDMRQNDVIEEAIRDLIEKYKHKEQHGVIKRCYLCVRFVPTPYTLHLS